MIIRVPRIKGFVLRVTSEQKIEICDLCDYDYGCGMKISKVDVKGSLPYQNIMFDDPLNGTDGP